MNLILYNGNIMTMDKDKPHAEAVAVKDDKIVLLGSNEEILFSREKDSKIIDLEGKTVVPGFNDSHMHLLGYGKSLETVDLNGCKSIDEMCKRIMKFVDENHIPAGSWVVGSGWNDSRFLENRLPSRQDLDSVSENHPIVMTRTCFHICVANTLALKEAEIFERPPGIEGGEIDKDQEGNPTGILRENALNLVTERIPGPGKDKIREMIIKASQDCLKAGLTSVQTDDFAMIKGDFKDILDSYFELDRENLLPVRVNEQVLLPDMDKLNKFINLGYKTGYGSEFFKIGPLKLLGDGSLGGRTAGLLKPYADDEGNLGICIYSEEQLYELIDTAVSNGLQTAVHAIGDRTMEMVLESYRRVLEKHRIKDPRLRIIHCQITSEEIINKFKNYGIIADIQPSFVSSDISIAESRVGRERAKWTYNWKTLIEKGVRVAGGSDCPVEPFYPLLGIYAAVTRQDLQGNPEGGWLPDQKLTVEEALYIYTMGSAYCTFEDDIKGSIIPGKLADMVVLSENIFEIEPNYIKDLVVEKTIVDGKIVYER